MQEEFRVWGWGGGGMKKCCRLVDISCNYNLNIGAWKYKLTWPVGLERSLLSGNVLDWLKKEKRK